MSAVRSAPVSAVVALGLVAVLATGARATTETVRWLKMAPTPFGSSVPNNSVYFVPGVGNVTITYSLPAVMTNTRLQNALMLNGSVANSGNTYGWTSQEAFSTIFTVGPDPLVPLPWTITYTFPGPLPCGSVYLGVQGLGQTTSFGGGKSTASVNQSGTFLGDWSGGGNWGPTLFTGGTGSFSMENSLTGAGGADPWWNTQLGVVRIDDAISSLTVNCSQIRGDGIGLDIGFSKDLATNLSLDWLPMAPTPFGSSVPNNSVFNLPGVGNVTMSYSLPAVMTNTRLLSPLLQNGNVVSSGRTYAWANQEIFSTVFTVGPDPLVPLPWTITYTFPNQLPCGSIYLGVSGLGQTLSFGGGKSTASVNQSGTFLGDWSGGGNWGPTLFSGGAGSFSMENSLTGLGGADPWWNTPLGVVRIDDSVSSLTVNFSQIRGDGIGLNIAYARPTWCDIGCALAGVSGDPLLVGTGSLAAGSLNAVDLSNAAPNAIAGLFVALASSSIPFKGGFLKPFPFFDPVLLATSPTGTIHIPFLMPTGVPSGTSLWVQFAIQDGAAVKGVSLSNALEGTTP